jgi:hypothetical protein
MKAKTLMIAAALLLYGQVAQAAGPTWVDWTSTTTGTLGTTNVSLGGPAWQISDGTGYYVDPFADAYNTYGGLNPSDVVQVYDSGIFALLFNQPVGNLYMSLVSIGNWSQPVRYQFFDPFTIEFSGPNEWGGGTCEAVGNVMTGTECNGILKISGNFGPTHPLVFMVMDPEGWHGFNVAAVPEPETYAMMLAGLGIVGAIARRRRRT